MSDNVGEERESETMVGLEESKSSGKVGTWEEDVKSVDRCDDTVTSSEENESVKVGLGKTAEGGEDSKALPEDTEEAHTNARQSDSPEMEQPTTTSTVVEGFPESDKVPEVSHEKVTIEDRIEGEQPTTTTRNINLRKVNETDENASEAHDDESSLATSAEETNEDSTKQANSEESKETATRTTTATDMVPEETETLRDSEYAEHVTYTDDGSAIYTDPKTNYRYKWCAKENNWMPCASDGLADVAENEHYRWCNETQKWLPKKAQTVTETEHYKWDAEKNEWILKKFVGASAGQVGGEQSVSEVVYGLDEEGQRIYTDKDGTVYVWDGEKSAWFPKIDDDFMARYQMNYGFIDNTSASEREKEQREKEAALQKEAELQRMAEEARASEAATVATAATGQSTAKRKGAQEPPKWFDLDPEHNTKVYVSNLPLDITIDEFAELMSKCGMIMRDPQTQKYKLKLYTEADGQIKGDGLCDYIKVESVDLALKILDEYNLRGHKIRVQRAKFQMRGEYNPALKPKRKKKDKEKLAKLKEKLFDWRPEKMRGERSKNEKIVIIKNLFHPDIFEKEVQLILDYQNDLREECSKCGQVRKVIIYDRHSEGVAQVNMATPEEADLVIQMMHGRFFGKRQLSADHWDGKTKYKIEETLTDAQKRLSNWDRFLETEEGKSTATTVSEEHDQPKSTPDI